MTLQLETLAFSAFLLFCRVGGCIMIAPGFSSLRVSMQVRLLIGIGVVLAISPLVLPFVSEAVAAAGEDHKPVLVFREAITGLWIGFLARAFFLALQFAANVIWSVIGLSGVPGIPLEESEAGSPLATLASSAAIVICMNFGLHTELIRAILDSYRIYSPDSPLDFVRLLSGVALTMSETYVMALRLAAPFIAYGLFVNFILGLANRFVPLISLYHATTGLVMLGGLFLFYILLGDWIMIFFTFYRDWLVAGGFG